MLHGDPFCSAICCRIVYGLDPPEGEVGSAIASTKCRGCGCDHGAFTVGCDTCYQRHAAREKKAAA